MKIGITGIGCNKNRLQSILDESGEEVNLLEYPVIGAIDADFVLAVYDGLFFSEFIERNIEFDGLIIPVFIDVDQIIVLGGRKKDYSEGEVCCECVTKRYLSSRPHTELFRIISNSKMFLENDSLLPESAELFINILMSLIKEQKIVGKTIVFDLRSGDLFIEDTIGFTNCAKCDKAPKNRTGLEGYIRERSK